MTPCARDEGDDRPRPAPWGPALARRLADRLGPRKARNVAAITLASVAVLLAVSFATSTRGHRTPFGTLLGADFAGFYSAGATLNAGAGDHLYDFGHQYQRYHALFPDAAAGESLPYASPPFFAALFRPLAALPYPWAYAAWLSISVALFYAGVRLLWRAPDDDWDPPADWPAVLAVALAFEPVAVECLVGGQASAFGFFWIAATLHCVRRDRPLRAGLALSACLYKPPLLVLILPMLLVTRQFRILAGFAAGAAALAISSVAVVGPAAAARYLDVLLDYSGNAAWDHAIFRTWKHVDARAFFGLLAPGGGPRVASALTLAALALGLAYAARFWWRSTGVDGARRDRLWAATLTWTLVFNLYVPIYDASLLVLSAALFYRAARTPDPTAAPQPLPARDKAWLVLLWCAPPASQWLARTTGFQPFTLLLVAFGIYQMRAQLAPQPARRRRMITPCLATPNTSPSSSTPFSALSIPNPARSSPTAP